MRWVPSASDIKEAKVAKRLRASSKFYRFLWEIRDELFDEDFEDLLIETYQPRGQDPCPPAMLAMVMLLQRYEGLSDARAVDAAENDRRWQLVLGTLGSDESPFGQGSLVRFRMRMLAHDLDRKLVEKTVELAKETGRFGWKKLRTALDSSPLEGAGRVEDTWNLIGRAMSKVVHTVSLALDTEESEIVSKARLSVLKADSVKSSLDINWDDEEAQHEALSQLLAQVDRLEKWVARRAKKESEKSPLKDALALLRRIVVQDIEPDPDGGGPRIKQGVSVDRIISVSDPDMRHGRKSRTKRFDGFKRHIAVVNGFIVATAIRPANIREHEAAPELLDGVSRYGAIEVLDIDRGYLANSTVEALHRAGVTINSRAWKTKNKIPGAFNKSDFRIDLRKRQITCPADKTAKIFPSGAAWFEPEECRKCSLKTQCTRADSRTVSIHRQEDLHLKLRKRGKTRSGRAELRRRVDVEHRLARVGAIQGRKARYRGVRKNELDLNRAAAVANLQRIAHLLEAV